LCIAGACIDIAGQSSAIVLTRNDVQNGPLRFADEFGRHKVLDLIGDLAVLERGGRLLEPILFLVQEADVLEVAQQRTIRQRRLDHGRDPRVEVRAVVADSGGILSHCAIVAREFGLPAVVGTRVGTHVLKDGMTITVDGSRGLVRIDSR